MSQSSTSQQRIINFMGQRQLAALISILLLIGSIYSLAMNGLVFGLDFTGGTQIEVGYQQPVALADVRQQLTDAGFEKAVVVHFGTESDVLIRLQGEPQAGLSDQVLAALNDNGKTLDLRRVDFVGPQVGDELREDGGLGIERIEDRLDEQDVRAALDEPARVLGVVGNEPVEVEGLVGIALCRQVARRFFGIAPPVLPATGCGCLCILGQRFRAVQRLCGKHLGFGGNLRAARADMFDIEPGIGLLCRSGGEERGAGQ